MALMGISISMNTNMTLKRHFISLLLLLSTATIWAANKSAVIKLPTSKYHFGLFSRNTVRRVVFPFVNTGKAPLVIQKASVSCGCTKVHYTQKPILPGQTGYILVIYHGKDLMPGHFSKSILVQSNASNGVIKLLIEGETR